MKLIPTIGLEVHVQLNTKSKMFCSCDNNAQDKKPNTIVCPICLGMPGTLPTPNKGAIKYAIMLGKYLRGEIAQRTKFDRKHYFYPDLPKGYQISQYDEPVVKGGRVSVGDLSVSLERIHLEEDAGKLTHPKGKGYSLVDLNRAGTPLVEIVTKPEITSPAQAKEFLQYLRLIVRYLGISNGDMEKGHLRCDANVSVRALQKPQSSSAPVGELGTPVEIKNLNSFLMVERALNYEIKRQSVLLQNGEKVTKETRGWDDDKGVNFSQRTKEFAPDYRYFPEPDIPCLYNLEKSFKVTLPESMEAKLNRARKCNVAQNDLEVIFRDDELLKLFDKISLEKNNKACVAKAMNIFINIPVARALKPGFVLDLARSLISGKIGAHNTKPIINEGLSTHSSFAKIIEDGGYGVAIEEENLDATIRSVIEKNAKVVADYRAGKKEALQYLLGQVMRETKGKADPRVIHNLLQKAL